MIGFLLSNWGELLVTIMAGVKVVVNLTPTTKDNAIFAVLDRIITALTGDRRKSKK